MPRADLFPRGRAVLSDCGRYRYRLEREVGAGGLVTFIMLNPSTADAELDDPTIRRCRAFTRAWGYGRLAVVNLFAWRATDPRSLRTVADPIGPENDAHIQRAIAESDLLIAAWGKERWRFVQVRALRVVFDLVGERSLHCIATTERGEPKHPLYQPGALIPARYDIAARR